MHQACPVEPGPSKATALVMPEISSSNSSGSQNYEAEFAENMRKLREILPQVKSAKLAALLVQHDGDLEAVVTGIMEEQAQLEADKAETLVEVARQHEREALAMASRVTIETSTLQAILTNVAENEKVKRCCSSGNILSFHRPERSTATITHNYLNDQSQILGNSANFSNMFQECPSCQRKLESVTFCFCPYCGRLLKKNYRRL